MKKNKAAVALGKLKDGVKECPSKLKSDSSRENIKKAIAKRWPKNKLK